MWRDGGNNEGERGTPREKCLVAIPYPTGAVIRALPGYVTCDPYPPAFDGGQVDAPAHLG